MNPRRGLVLDANILLRAVFGIRVRQILEAYEGIAAFYSPDVCFMDAEKYIPDLARRREAGFQARTVRPLTSQASWWTGAYTKSTKNLLASESSDATHATGPSWRLRYCRAFRCGLRIGTSLGAASLHGPRTVSRYTCKATREMAEKFRLSSLRFCPREASSKVKGTNPCLMMQPSACSLRLKQ